MLPPNEKGLTLIETLAVIVVGSIVMILVFNIISSGINNSKQVQERANLQNESNYLLVVLREFHERGIVYTITFNNGEMIVEDVNNRHKTLFNNFLYEVNGNDTGTITIEPKSQHKTFNIKLKLSSKEYDIEHKTNTILQVL